MARSVIDGKVVGARQLERALKQLPRATAKGVLKRAMIKAAAPTVAAARLGAPVGDGDLRDSIKASTRLTNNQKPQTQSNGAAVVYVGPTTPKGAHGHFVEFGTSNKSARPFLRSAWSATRGQVLQDFSGEVWDALAKSARRLAKQAGAGKLSKTAKRALRG